MIVVVDASSVLLGGDLTHAHEWNREIEWGCRGGRGIAKLNLHPHKIHNFLTAQELIQHVLISKCLRQSLHILGSASLQTPTPLYVWSRADKDANLEQKNAAVHNLHKLARFCLARTLAQECNRTRVHALQRNPRKIKFIYWYIYAYYIHFRIMFRIFSNLYDHIFLI